MSTNKDKINLLDLKYFKGIISEKVSYTYLIEYRLNTDMITLNKFNQLLDKKCTET
jgi:hypothetical protein